MYRRGCARFLGHLVAVWEVRSRQVYVEPQTPGPICPDVMTLQGREAEHLNSLYRELGPQLSLDL